MGRRTRAAGLWVASFDLLPFNNCYRSSVNNSGSPTILLQSTFTALRFPFLIYSKSNTSINRFELLKRVNYFRVPFTPLPVQDNGHCPIESSIFISSVFAGGNLVCLKRKYLFPSKCASITNKSAPYLTNAT